MMDMGCTECQEAGPNTKRRDKERNGVRQVVEVRPTDGLISRKECVRGLLSGEIGKLSPYFTVPI